MPKINNPYDHAIYLLSRREQSVKELTDKLLKKDYTEQDILDALSQLQAQKLQCNQRFVESMVRTRANQGKGPRYIIHELGQHDIPAQQIHDQLDRAGIHWGELAAEVRERRFGETLPEAYPEQAKQMRFLQNRGFEHAHIRLALRPKDAI